MVSGEKSHAQLEQDPLDKIVKIAEIPPGFGRRGGVALWAAGGSSR
jgi:hypothetical protein